MSGSSDPLVLARRWLDEALAFYGPSRVEEATAMALATVRRGGEPTVRYVLLKGLDERGFIFYTNYQSDKGIQLSENPVAAIALWWPRFGRQLRAEGRVEVVPSAESDAYFATRPRLSQIGAWASEQSREMRNTLEMKRRVAEFERRFPKKVPRPPHWGGYLLRPDRLEFWTAGEGRLHVRHLAERTATGWRWRRLYP